MKKISKRAALQEKKFFSLNGDKIKESSKILGGKNVGGITDITQTPSASTDRLCQGGCGNIAPF